MKIDKIFGPNFRVLLLPVLANIIIIILIILNFNFSYNKITDLNRELGTSNDKISQLEQKLMVLREVEGNILGDKHTVMTALPSKNSGLYTWGQIGELAFEQELKLADRALSSETPLVNDISTSNIQFILTGEFEKLFSFFEQLSNFAPLTKIGNVSISGPTDNLYSVEVAVIVYNADILTQLPAITDPIKTLNESEIEKINDLSRLKPPQLIGLEPDEESRRNNPFE